MSARGVFAVDRGIWDDPDFAAEPFSEREAFLWLVGEAAWRATNVRVGSARVALERGQCAFSTRFMAARWKWSESRVRRFLGRMQKRGMIDAATDAGATQLNVKDDEHISPDITSGDAPSDRDVNENRRKEEEIKNKQTDSCPKPGKPVRTRTAYPADFEDFWKPYPTDPLMSKSDAAKAWAKLTKDDRASAIAAIPGFVAHCRANPDYRPVHAVRFLTSRRFDGFAPSAPLGGAGKADGGSATVDFGGGFVIPLGTVQSVLQRDTWIDKWGPRPGSPGCKLPRQFWPEDLGGSVASRAA